MDFQRSTFSGTIYDKENDAVWYYPDKNGNMVKSKLATPFPSSETQKLMKTTRRRLVARVDGEYGMVAQLRSDLPREIGGIYWVFQDNAYTSPYLPIFTGVTRIPEVYSTYNPKEYSDNSARWAIDFVDNLLYLNWQDGKKDLEAARAPWNNPSSNATQRSRKSLSPCKRKIPRKRQNYSINTRRNVPTRSCKPTYNFGTR